VTTQLEELATRYDIPPEKLASPTVTAPPKRQPYKGEGDYWLPALLGEVTTEGGFRHVAEVRWILRERAAAGLDSPPEVVEALAEGDRRTLCDPRRFLDIDTWSTTVVADPEATALATLRAAVGTVDVAEAIATALGAGIDPDTVRRTLREVRSDA
jgi:hypothetical protein